MSYPIVRLVDAPDPEATVRYDFNDHLAVAQRKALAESFSLGAPSLDSPVDAVSPMYGRRPIGFNHTVKGQKRDAMEALAVVSRELLRPSNWLLVQLAEATRPSWWRLWATGPDALSWDRVSVDTASGGPGTPDDSDTWVLPINLTADAFGYGERIIIPTVQVVQSPADLAGPTRYAMRYVLPTIHGDAPTNLRVAFTPSVSNPVAGNDGGWLVGSVSGPEEYTSPVVNIGNSDGFAATGGTAGGTSNAAYFNGDRRLFTVAAATPNLLSRLTGNFTDLPIGRYKVELRYEIDASTVTALFQLQVQAPGALGQIAVAPPTPVGPLTANPTAIRQGWVDLGEVTVPTYQAPLAEAGIANGDFNGWTLLIGTADGSAITGKIDAFRLIPIDAPAGLTTRLLEIEAAFQAQQATITIDGDTETWWATASGAYTDKPPVASLRGGFPLADPAQEQNILEFMALSKGDHNDTGMITEKDAQTAVDISYHPRLLHLDGRP